MRIAQDSGCHSRSNFSGSCLLAYVKFDVALMLFSEMLQGCESSSASSHPPVVLISDRLCHSGILPEHELNEHHGRCLLLHLQAHTHTHIQVVRNRAFLLSILHLFFVACA